MPASSRVAPLFRGSEVRGIVSRCLSSGRSTRSRRRTTRRKFSLSDHRVLTGGESGHHIHQSRPSFRKY